MSYSQMRQAIIFNRVSIVGLLILSLLLVLVYGFNQYKSITITAAFFGGGVEGLLESVTLAIFTTGAMTAIGFATQSHYKKMNVTLSVLLFCAFFGYGVNTVLRQNNAEAVTGQFELSKDGEYKTLSSELTYEKSQLQKAQLELSRLTKKEQTILSHYQTEISGCKKKSSRAKKDRCSAYEGTQKNERLDQNNVLIVAQKKVIGGRDAGVTAARVKAEKRVDSLAVEKDKAVENNLLSLYSIFAALKYDASATFSFSLLFVFFMKAISLILLNVNLVKKMARSCEEDVKNFEQAKKKLSPADHLELLKGRIFNSDRRLSLSKNKLWREYKGILNRDDIDEALHYGVSIGSLKIITKGNGKYFDWNLSKNLTD